jgi:hypothetical protein
MIFSPLLNQECDLVEIEGAIYRVDICCLHLKSPNLKAMSQATKQRFAVSCAQPLENSFIMKALERAYIEGAMSSIKLITAHKDALHFLLERKLASSGVSACRKPFELAHK